MGKGRVVKVGAWRRGLIAVAGLLLFALASVSVASAAEAPPGLWNRCAGGEEDVACTNPRGVAIAPVGTSAAGNVYLADQSNQRIVEYTPWGEFVRTWGWGVVDGSSELQVCTVVSSCRKGIEGEGAGQFSSPQGIAIDSSGNVYVAELFNHRVQKFDSEGHFLLMFGGKVNKTKVEALAPEAEQNRCPISPGDVCQAGVTGSGNGQFEAWPSGGLIAVSPTPTSAVYVGDKERIQVFDTSGAYLKSLPLGAGETVQSLAAEVKNPGNLFVGTGSGFSVNPDVRKLDTSGATLCTVEVGAPTALATDGAGTLYAFDKATAQIRQFAASDCSDKESPFGKGEIKETTGLAASSVCLSKGADVYVSNLSPDSYFLRAYGPAPTKLASCPKPLKPPSILSQSTLSVGTASATVQASINPRFWDDTRYFVQYGTAACLEAEDWEAACVKEKPADPGALLGSGVDVPLTTTGVFLGSLETDTDYRYRFVAKSGGGGPVLGAGGKIGIDGSDTAFHTFASPLQPPSADPCPNARFRIGPAAFLADCRAYEMVSPVDKAGGDIFAFNAPSFRPAALEQSSTLGDKLTYSSFRSFGDALSEPYSSQYISSRVEGSGWSTHGISPPRGVPPGVGALEGTDTEFKAFSADLCGSWLIRNVTTSPGLAPGAVEGVRNLYRRANCGAESYQALTTVAPPERQPLQYELELQGLSADGSKAVYAANDKLTPDAPSLNAADKLIYESSAGELRFVCLLPGGGTAKSCSLGTAPFALSPDGRSVNTSHAVSEDGSRIFWSDSSSQPGHIFVRIDGTITIPVSQPTTPGAAQFWTAAADGSKAFFSSNQDLYEFEVDTEETRLIAHKASGVVGASEDASRIYLISAEKLGDPGEENSAGKEAQAGKPNLYLYEGGAFVFIGTLSSDDATTEARHPSLTNVQPFNHAARVSPDGSTVAFISNGSPTGYDSTDVKSGKADAEVYRYSADSGQLDCVSCNPSGARPIGRNVLGNPSAEPFFAGAFIPGAENQLYAPRALSDDGTRLFFNSFEPLVLRDTNGKQDVYEWEEMGAGSCNEESRDFSPPAGGCVSLITSGESPFDSEFVDASPSGKDVFVRTSQSLVASDPGQFDIYDVRVGGGFASQNQPPPAPPCEGESCQSSPPLPDQPTPSSSSFEGSGNLTPLARCAKGKKRVISNGRARCASRKKTSRAKQRQRRSERHYGRAK